MDFILPSQCDRIITAPLHVLCCGFGFRIVLGESILKVARYHPNFAIVCVQCHELAIGRYGNVLERALVQASVICVGGVHNVNGLTDGEKNFDIA
jgi:hypothetical protein